MQSTSFLDLVGLLLRRSGGLLLELRRVHYKATQLRHERACSASGNGILWVPSARRLSLLRVGNRNGRGHARGMGGDRTDSIACLT